MKDNSTCKIFIPPSFSLCGLIFSGKLKKSLGYTQSDSNGEINRDGSQISLKQREDYLVQGNRLQDSIFTTEKLNSIMSF